MAPVSTICDEHCRVALPSLDATDRKETACCLRGYFRSSLRRQDEKGILFLVKNKVKKYILRQYQGRNTSAYCEKALKSFNFVSGKHPAAVRWPGWNIELPLETRLVSIRKLSWNVTCYVSSGVMCDKMSLYFWPDAELRLIFFCRWIESQNDYN